MSGFALLRRALSWMPRRRPAGSTRCSEPALLAVKGEYWKSLSESKVLGLHEWQGCSKRPSLPGFACEQVRREELSAVISDQERSLQVRVRALCIILL